MDKKFNVECSYCKNPLYRRKSQIEAKCVECHKEFHKKYGWTNNNEKQLKDFIENS